MGSTAQELIEQLKALGPVTAAERVALRTAAHSVPISDHEPRGFIGPREQDRPWMGAPELAAWLRVNPATVHTMLARGDFGPGQAFRLHNRAGGSTWKIRRTAVEAWAATQLRAAS
jgi:hypothetical protein